MGSPASLRYNVLLFINGKCYESDKHLNYTLICKHWCGYSDFLKEMGLDFHCDDLYGSPHTRDIELCLPSGHLTLPVNSGNDYLKIHY